MKENTHIAHWRELCHYLSLQPGNSATKTKIPAHLSYLLSHRNKRQRMILDVVFYASGWGWRLRKDWVKRLSSVVS